MRGRIRQFIFKTPYAGLISAGLVSVTLIAFLGATGAFDATLAPAYFTSARAYYGMLMLYVLLPAYVTAAVIYSLRASLQLAGQVDDKEGTRLTETVTSYSPVALLVFILLGALYALLFNVPGNGLNFFVADPVERATIVCQTLIWVFVGIMGSARFRIAIAFNRAGGQVPIDIFEPGNLRPFAYSGLIDVLIIAGAFVISTVQSLDFSFRMDNYSKALLIAVPSSLFFAVYPQWQIHRRMQQIRQAQLEELDTLIRAAPKDLLTNHMNELEVLLQRRERVKSAHTWPIDIAIVQRFLFYIIIPPLAWIGAALVEMIIEGVVSGS